MKSVNLLFFIIVLFGFYSCEKGGLIDEGEAYLIKQIFIEDELYSELTYTNADLISEEKSKFSYTKHNYNSANQLVQSDHYWDERIASSSSNVLNEAMNRTEWVNPGNTEKDSYFSYEYHSSGRLKKRTITRVNGGESLVDTFIYNTDGIIEKRISFHENKESVNDDYFYDEKGNLIKQQRYFVSDDGTPVLQTTTEYEFDDKHNPYLAFRSLMIPGRNTNANNITKETYTLHFEMEDVQVTEYSYEYNVNAYPVKRNDGTKYVYY
jgi:hypothetical protein